MKKCIVCGRAFKGTSAACKKCTNNEENNLDYTLCISCGHKTDFMINSYCLECAVGKMDDFKVIKEYLYQHPGLNAKQLSEITGISISIISRYISEGRVDVIGG